MSQRAKILRHMQAGESITPIDALNLYGCFRLGARIWDLRAAGYDVNSTMVDGHAEYSMEPNTMTDTEIDLMNADLEVGRLRDDGEY